MFYIYTYLHIYCQFYGTEVSHSNLFTPLAVTGGRVQTRRRFRRIRRRSCASVSYFAFG